MPICGNCGTEGTRIRSRWSDKGVELPDECPQCAPQSFGKFSTPSDQKIHLGFEAHPNEYEKRYDDDGVFYIRKPEYRAEQEARLSAETEDEKCARESAEAEKRATRRTDPMNETELAAAIAKARMYANYLEEEAAEAQKQAQEAELQSWIQKATSQVGQA